MLPKSEFGKDGYCVLHRKKWWGFGLLWGKFKEYLKQNIITAVLRKANAYSVVICRLIKKSIMYIKIDPRGITDSNFVYEVLVRRNLI